MNESSYDVVVIDADAPSVIEYVEHGPAPREARRFGARRPRALEGTRGRPRRPTMRPPRSASSSPSSRAQPWQRPSPLRRRPVADREAGRLTQAGSRRRRGRRRAPWPQRRSPRRRGGHRLRAGTRTMMRRPSFTASIGPSPVRGFMAAIELPLSWLTLHYLPCRAALGNRGASVDNACIAGSMRRGAPTALDSTAHQGGVQAVDPQQMRSHPTWSTRNSTTRPHRYQRPAAGRMRRAAGRAARVTEGARLREEHRQQVQRVADRPDPDVGSEPTHGGRRDEESEGRR